MFQLQEYLTAVAWIVLNYVNMFQTTQTCFLNCKEHDMIV